MRWFVVFAAGLDHTMSRKKRRKHAQAWDYAWWEEPKPNREELLRRVEPLVAQIRRVDEVVDKIAQGEGRVADLVGLEQILVQPIAVGGSSRQPVTLSQPAGVRSALSFIARELHLEVQAVDGQYPCYYCAASAAAGTRLIPFSRSCTSRPSRMSYSQTAGSWSY